MKRGKSTTKSSSSSMAGMQSDGAAGNASASEAAPAGAGKSSCLLIISYYTIPTSYVLWPCVFSIFPTSLDLMFINRA